MARARAIIDWPAEMARFRPLMEDLVVLRRTRQLSAATVRATCYYGTPRHRIYTWGIARRMAALTSETAVRHGLLADLATVRSLLEQLFGAARFGCTGLMALNVAAAFRTSSETGRSPRAKPLPR